MAESTTPQPSTADPTVKKGPSLDQPRGAVQMEDLSQPKPAEGTAEPTAANELPVPAKDAVPVAQSSSSSGGLVEPIVAPSAKGKEKATQFSADPDEEAITQPAQTEGSGKGKERATDDETADALSDDKPETPAPTENLACRIALLHAQLSSRWTFKIDERYLDKRGVEIPGTSADGRKDPLSLTVKTLKELILREWKAEWQAPPSSVQYIRLIYYGKFLQDEQTLSSKSSCFHAACCSRG